ncbi:hypothetical protein E2C01_041678 [Portunus trituberculatus]|uniref:Uncharacterized protein n=1 Tax=Portunus trituberculatus TaxID=210409 RepID=A0A5B7FRC6_PORTR|nr:hypothetical protein [Portunus trituberculatus]
MKDRKKAHLQLLKLWPEGGAADAGDAIAMWIESVTPKVILLAASNRGADLGVKFRVDQNKLLFQHLERRDRETLVKNE